MIPRFKLKSYGHRAFSVSIPRLWNDISENIKYSADLLNVILSFYRNLIFLSVILLNDYV